MQSYRLIRGPNHFGRRRTSNTQKGNHKDNVQDGILPGVLCGDTRGGEVEGAKVYLGDQNIGE